MPRKAVQPDLGERTVPSDDLVCEQAETAARQFRKAGDLAAALAVYDNLAPALHHRPAILAQRADIVKRLLRQAAHNARHLLGTDDIAAALAVFETLPLDLRSHPEVVRERSNAIEFARRQAHRKARAFRHAGDLAGAVAVYNRVATELSDDSEILSALGSALYQSGDLNGARDVLLRVLSFAPGQEDAAYALGAALAGLGRTRELEDFIAAMLAALPATYDRLQKAAQLAEKGLLLHLAAKLHRDAIGLAASTDTATIIAAAENLLAEGAQGRVVALLDDERLYRNADVRDYAAELRARAHDQLRRAGRAADAGPIGMEERAGILVAHSIIEQAGRWSEPARRSRRGIAVVAASLGVGGSQTQIRQIIRQLAGAQRERVGPLFLLLGPHSGPAPDLSDDDVSAAGITIDHLQWPSDAGKVLPPDVMEKLHLLPSDIFRATVSLTAALKFHNPEAIIVIRTLKSVAAILAASLAGVPRILVSERSCARRPDELLQFVYQQIVTHDWASVTTNSAATAREFAGWLGVPAERLAFIYNGVEVDNLRTRRDPAAALTYRRSLGIEDGTRIVGSGFQSRLTKRPRLWIEAAACIAKRAPDVAFVIVGDVARDYLLAAIRHHGMESRFHLPGPSNDVVNWLGAMDAVLLTSQFEGTPNILLEAQALGRPVVATDVGGSGETFIPGETGLLVSAHPDPEEIADAVMRVLDDRNFALRAERIGPHFVRDRFGADRMGAELVDRCLRRDARRNHS